MTTPLILCILDGWGTNPESAHNAIAQADTPNWNNLIATYPHSELSTSGEDVGLPEGQMGNSEVGHMTIGAGRVIFQDLPRIDRAIADGSLAENPIFRRFLESLKRSGNRCHLLGLLSPGGVHSHQHHILTLAQILHEANIPTCLHAFLDGRDTPPKSAREYLKEAGVTLKKLTRVRYATISGRYYAMDRDKRWDRVEKAYRAMVEAEGPRAASPDAAIAASYEQGVTDEFILPTIIGDYAGMQDGDALLIANFRADRVRQLGHALLDPAFTGFARPRRPQFSAALGMSEYSTELNRFLDTLFPPEQPKRTLGEVASKAELKQLRIAETEKYAHVTFFLNGGREDTFPGEDRTMVPSPKVATYDLQPEMSAPELTDKLVAAIASGKYGLIVANYANTDMVGHTGNIEAAKKAVEAVDTALGHIYEAAKKAGAALLITADHGNAEMMQDSHSGEPHTAHTTLSVPFVLAAPGRTKDNTRLKNGTLADVAPTALEIMGLYAPPEMTGVSLIAQDR